MTQLLMDLVAAAFATVAIVDIWFNGSIFAEARSTVQSWPGLAHVSRTRALVAELLGCPLCLNTQVAIWLTALLTVAHFTSAPVGVFLRFPVYAFAIAGVAWLINEHRPGGGYNRGNATH